MAAPLRHVVVLGGGISGLSVAYNLLRSSPKLRVTLVEAADHVGGWVDSREIGPESIICETGPRTLRPAGRAGLATLQLVKDLGLDDALATVPRTAAAAKNRFLYGNGRLHLLQPWPMLTSSYLRPILWPMAKEPFRSSPTSVQTVVKTVDGQMAVADESIRSFITRRFSSIVADRMVSAVVSGIYAGNISELSARACFGRLWHAERKHQSIIRGLWAMNREPDNAELVDIRRQLLDTTTTSPSIKSAIESSVYTFRNGMQTLTDTMARTLQQQYTSDRYRLLLNSAVKSVSFNTQQATVQLNDGTQIKADQIVGAVPARVMSQLLGTLTPTSLQNIGAISSNVAVVNLIYAKPLNIPNGFGYLIPTVEQDTMTLGVVFDSQSLPANINAPNATRLTVMMGGRYRWSQQQLDHVSEDEFLEQALLTVRKHLGITDQPMHTLVSIQRQCIPQYQVGHADQLHALHRDLPQLSHGRLAVTGASYTGVSINDCIWHAEQLANRIATHHADDASMVKVTGLETAEFM
ncbi:hypothetical protein BDF19DRAFT_448833 [Syncephalis fuscata]|nr:hypothetical protein BDF19DRAFT_448833 [Syncephalis fuscata]